MEIVKTHKCCSKCKVEKTLDNFTVSNNNRCRDCKREVKHIYAKNNPERHKELYTKDNALSRVKNANNIRAYRQRPDIKERDYIQHREWVKNNRDKVDSCRIAYTKKNEEALKKKNKDWRHKNKERCNEITRAWRGNNPEKIKQYRINSSEVVKNNPILKMRGQVTRQINKALKRFGYGKNSHTRTLLGVDYGVFRVYIERQFKKGMNWDNNGLGDGKWHLDHIMPLASAKNEKELLALFHYTNLRPLWSKENLSKGAKIIEHQLKMVI